MAKSKTKKPKTMSLRDWCDQCEALAINGYPCHERGCPNEKKSRVNEQWVTILECRECGSEVIEGNSCDCQDDVGYDMDEEWPWRVA